MRGGDGANGETDDLVTAYTYNARGQTETMRDPLNRTTRYEYDARGLRTRAVFAEGSPDQGVMTFAYDAAGNQTAATDENGHRTSLNLTPSVAALAAW
ncbi:MAG: RHS repeat domain-containing protein [Planctomycetia bacterium]|nr:RHS repeat domain-containing protein [Planctomycetia bacterium]